MRRRSGKEESPVKNQRLGTVVLRTAASRRQIIESCSIIYRDGSRKLAEKIYARNASHTFFLTKYGEHNKTSFTAYEGDVN